MAVRLRVRIERVSAEEAPTLETVAIANSGFESGEPEILLPARAAERLGLWPPPAAAAVRQFDSPATVFTMVAVPDALRVCLPMAVRRGTGCVAVISEHETEVVLNDHVVERLGIQIVAAARGMYRVGGQGRLRRSDPPERW